MDSRARELVSMGKRLFSQKSHWDSLNQEIAEHFYPMRADFTSPFTLGTDFSTNLMESYPVMARETLGNSINAMLRQGDWFAVQTGLSEIDDEPENARWLEYASTHHKRLIYDRRANFVRATSEADHDYVTFGNPVLSVEESPDRSHMLFRSWHPKSCAWMENAVGKIDHVQRDMPTSARNIMARKAWADKAHSNIKQAMTSDPAKAFKIHHIVLPFDEIYGDDRKKRRQYAGADYCSLYVDCEHDIILSEAPLHVFNYVIPRWRTVSGFAQGFSPATINALPDGRMLQSLARIILEQGEKAVDPAIVARGEIFRDAVNLYAGGMTYVDIDGDMAIRDAMQEVGTSSNMQIGLEMKADVRNLIAESFLLNKLMLPSARDMTAFETQARLDEFRRAALPFFGPIESEYHLPLLDVSFQMALRADAFDLREMPKALADADVTFTFESPLNTAEGRKDVQAFQESVQILAASAQFDKNIVTTMDFKQMTKDAMKGTGAKADWFADEEVQLEEEEKLAQVDRLASAAAALREGAGVAGDVAGATQQLQAAGML